ncbi:hypothetical protein AB1Y20_020882 [Prymnesium parvum]|uniref:EF-hand domain-containing protein n=1 Tax=Prymnesium parvum TaxID=97485 RepID=A0AB34JYS6_PRYPA
MSAETIRTRAFSLSARTPSSFPPALSAGRPTVPIHRTEFQAWRALAHEELKPHEDAASQPRNERAHSFQLRAKADEGAWKRQPLESLLDALGDRSGVKSANQQQLVYEARQVKMAKSLYSSLARVVDVFRRIDTNHSGEIDFEEFRHAIITRVPASERDFDEHDIVKLFNEFDRDGDGRISYQEFQKSIKRWFKASNPSDTTEVAHQAKPELGASPSAGPGAATPRLDAATPFARLGTAASGSQLGAGLAGAGLGVGTPGARLGVASASSILQANCDGKPRKPRVSSAPTSRRPTAALVPRPVPEPASSVAARLRVKSTKETLALPKWLSRWKHVVQRISRRMQLIRAPLQDVALHALKRRKVLQLLREFKDQQAGGVCKVKTFRQLLRLYHPTATPHEISLWMSWVAQIQAEWAEAETRTQNVRAIFDALDTDGDGTIQRPEFLQLQASAEISQQRLIEVFDQRDIDRNGVLDFKEFMQLVDENHLLHHSSKVIAMAEKAKTQYALEQRAQQEIWRIGLPDRPKNKKIDPARPRTTLADITRAAIDDYEREAKMRAEQEKPCVFRSP